MAHTTFLKIVSVATNKVIEGECQQPGIAGEDYMDCLSYEDEVTAAREEGSGKATGRRKYGAVKARLRVNKSTPLLFKALTTNEELECTFDQYLPAGDGTDQHILRIVLKGAQISAIRRYSPDATDPASSKAPPMEEVSFVCHTVCVTHPPTGIEHEDSWAGKQA